MLKSKQGLILSTLLVLNSACMGGKIEDATPVATPTPTPAPTAGDESEGTDEETVAYDFVGTWATDCIEAQGGQEGEFEIVTVIFDANLTVTASAQRWSNSDCTGEPDNEYTQEQMGFYLTIGDVDPDNSAVFSGIVGPEGYQAEGTLTFTTEDSLSLVVPQGDQGDFEMTINRQ